jgi:hypothetical protein
MSNAWDPAGSVPGVTLFYFLGEPLRMVARVLGVSGRGSPGRFSKLEVAQNGSN